MALAHVSLLYRPQDLKLSVVLDNYRQKMNEIIDVVNGIDTDVTDLEDSDSISLDDFSDTYFSKINKVTIKNYYSTGTGLTGGGDLSEGRTLSLSHLGLESLTDPGADRIFFWDDSETASGWLTPTNALSITSTTLNVLYDGTTVGLNGSNQLYVLPHTLLGALHSDTIAGDVLRGSIIRVSSAIKWEALPLGAANRVLHSNGTDAAWAQADHGLALTGLTDDDHTQYLLADGTRALAGNWALGGYNLTGGGSIYSDYYILGTNPASAGRIRIPNNATISARNNANNADVVVMYLDTSDVLQIYGVPGQLKVYSDGEIRILGEITLKEQDSAPSAVATFGKIYMLSSDNLLYYKDDSGNVYDLTAGGAGGAPLNADYIVGTANATLTAEVVKAWLADNYTLDDYPSSPNALDDEFENSAIAAKWTIVNDPGISEATYPGFIYGTLTELGTDNFDNLIRMYQTAPTGTAVATYIAKVSIAVSGQSGEDGEFASIGIYLGNSVNDEMVGSQIQFNNALATDMPFQACGNQASAGTLAQMTTSEPILASPTGNYYVKLVKTTTAAYTSANTYMAYFSHNGIVWQEVGSTSFTFTTACNEVGIFIRRPKSQTGTPAGEFAADFFRRTV